MNNTVLLLAFITMLSGGQVLFKKAAVTTPDMKSVSGLMDLLGNVWFWLALLLYGAATLLWIFILQKVALSTAYPFAALGFILVPCAGYFLFGETLSPWHILGTILIISGVLLISYKAQA